LKITAMGLSQAAAWREITSVSTRVSAHVIETQMQRASQIPASFPISAWRERNLSDLH
jgi:hypothetical protein